MKYIYKCSKCGVNFWWEQSIKSELLKDCIICGGENCVEVVITGGQSVASRKSDKSIIEKLIQHKYEDSYYNENDVYSVNANSLDKANHNNSLTKDFLVDNREILNKYKNNN
ncbi:MAG: hypothetical protein ACOCV8_03405 [Spirochaetota bacterium]